MSSYAVYIWSCYIFAFCLLGGQVVFAFQEWKTVCKKTLKSFRDKNAL